MVSAAQAEYESVVREAVQIDGIESAVVFVRPSGSFDLVLAAAAGIDGPPLDRLSEAVRNPAHPITRTLADGKASFDVLPTAPGGPALRSHVPITLGGGPVPHGVLAVSHNQPLEVETRRRLEGLAKVALGSSGDGR
jgi:hypothetical protein